MFQEEAKENFIFSCRWAEGSIRVEKSASSFSDERQVEKY
jgi:hypothetical protein